MSLSIKNGWMDSDRRVYIYFTQEDAMAMMSCGKHKGVSQQTKTLTQQQATDR